MEEASPQAWSGATVDLHTASLGAYGDVLELLQAEFVRSVATGPNRAACDATELGEPSVSRQRPVGLAPTGRLESISIRFVSRLDAIAIRLSADLEVLTVGSFAALPGVDAMEYLDERPAEVWPTSLDELSATAEGDGALAVITAMIGALESGTRVASGLTVALGSEHGRASTNATTQVTLPVTAEDEDRHFEETFAAFWNNRPDMSDLVTTAFDIESPPLSIIEDAFRLGTVGHQLEVHDGTPTRAADLERRSPQVPRLRWARSIALGVRPTVGIAAAVTLAMVVIG